MTLIHWDNAKLYRCVDPDCLHTTIDPNQFVLIVGMKHLILICINPRFLSLKPKIMMVKIEAVVLVSKLPSPALVRILITTLMLDIKIALGDSK